VNAKRRLPWSAAELQKLKSLIDLGRTVPEIARILDRTQEGVRRRAALEGWYASPSLLYCPLPASGDSANEDLAISIKAPSVASPVDPYRRVLPSSGG
jgi:hypothetical protein